MTPLILHQKTGFKNKEPLQPVVIRDSRLKVFYSTEGMKPVEYFNLPAGKYYVDKGALTVLKKPLDYPLSPMPRPERRFPFPGNFNIVFIDNPNKCTIFWSKKTIAFDHSFKDKTLPEIYYVLFHEYGHHLYATEKFADLFSANLMKKRGFNPSQIGNAPLTTLSSAQFERKKHIVKQSIRYGRIKSIKHSRFFRK